MGKITIAFFVLALVLSASNPAFAEEPVKQPPTITVEVPDAPVLLSPHGEIKEENKFKKACKKTWKWCYKRRGPILFVLDVASKVAQIKTAF